MPDYDDHCAGRGGVPGTCFISFKEFLLVFEFAMLEGNKDLVFSPKMLRCIANVDETEASLDGSNTRVGGRPTMSWREAGPASPNDN